jgi:hypothetical protein
MSGPRRGVAAGVVVGAASIVLLGCGGGTKHAAGAPHWDPKSGPPHCSALPAGTYRTCVFDGHPFHGEVVPIAHRGQVVTVNNLTARIERVSLSGLSPGPGAFGLGRARAQGTFIIVTLAVTDSDTNPLPPPGEAFYEQSSGMVGLLVGGKILTPSGKAEGADRHSFLNGKYFERGVTRTGDVIFDVPSSQAHAIVRSDALVLSGFGLTLGSGIYGLLKLS